MDRHERLEATACQPRRQQRRDHRDPFIGPWGVAVDPGAGKVYWSGFNSIAQPFSGVYRANLDGSNVEIVINSLTIPTSPEAIELDLVNGKLYWTDGGRIWRSDLDGTNDEELVSFPDTADVAVDPGGGKFYFTDSFPDRVTRADLDATNFEDIVNAGFLSPEGIELDLTRGKFYWADRGSDSIERIDLDGSNRISVVSGLQDPRGVVVCATGGTSGDCNVAATTVTFPPIMPPRQPPWVYTSACGRLDESTPIAVTPEGSGVELPDDIAPTSGELRLYQLGCSCLSRFFAIKDRTVNKVRLEF